MLAGSLIGQTDRRIASTLAFQLLKIGKAGSFVKRGLLKYEYIALR